MSDWHHFLERLSQGAPVLQALGISALTFVSEDAATVASAALSRAGTIHWGAAFLGCFLGIWLGDIALYALARTAGGRLRQWQWTQRRIPSSRWQQTETWFARHGTACLLMSRWLPGTRLVTFLMAGLLRMPALTFFMTTGFTTLLWTTLWFVAFDRVSDRFQSIPVALAFMVFVLVAGTFVVKKISNSRSFREWISALKAGREWARRWEFWPAWVFYFPLLIRILGWMIRFRSVSIPCNANPGMYLGGLVGESKYDILRILQTAQPEFTATTHRIESGTMEERCRALANYMAEAGLAYPIVLKPDVGQRGAGFKRVLSAGDAEQYLRQNTDPVLLQEYAPGPFEAGIFYIRYPDETAGRIFAITEKLFPTLVGDGVSTLRQCIANHPRARFQQRILEHRFRSRLEEVPTLGEVVRLVEAGNHAQGCEFRDGRRWWTQALEQRIDAISKSHPGFYFGRFDIRFEDEVEWMQGRGFKIVELNGVSAEATNLYDARNSLIDAYRILFEQWRHAFAIGAQHRRRGVPAPSLLEIASAWRRDRRQVAVRMIAD